MFYYSKLNHRKIIHTENCFIADKFSADSTGVFYTAHDAFDAGYKLCRRCNPIAIQYKKEKGAITEYCSQNGLSFHYSDRSLRIKGDGSKWVITLSPNAQSRLYHRNSKVGSTDSASEISGYHEQNVRCDSLLSYCQYINRHDKYRKTHPEVKFERKEGEKPPRKGTKRWAKEQRKKKKVERYEAIRRVLAMIDSVAEERLEKERKIYA